MKLSFTKMQGCANDYIYLDCRTSGVPEEIAALSERLSRRHFSIGADGIICICAPVTAGADAMMRIFNADGSEGKMCGNGIRCVGKYIYDNGIARKKKLTVETLSGIKTLYVTEENGKAVSLTVDMGEPILTPHLIPVKFNGNKMINEPVNISGTEYRITAVSMGNPHAVVFCDDIKGLNLEKTGPLFEFNPIFPEQVNTEFIRVKDSKNLEMRVWERGSGETFACGTGACAAAAAAVLNGYCKRTEEIAVHLKCGVLTIKYAEDGHIYMRGAAEKVYEGVYCYES